MRESRRRPSSCVVMGASPDMEETDLRAPLRHMDYLAHNTIIQSQLLERVEHLRRTGLFAPVVCPCYNGCTNDTNARGLTALAPTLTSLSLGKANISDLGLAHLTCMLLLSFNYARTHALGKTLMCPAGLVGARPHQAGAPQVQEWHHQRSAHFLRFVSPRLPSSMISLRRLTGAFLLRACRDAVVEEAEPQRMLDSWA